MPRATRLAPAPQGSNAGSMAGILILMVALTAMVVLFIMTNKRVVSDGTPAPAPEPVDPFAHMDYSEDDAEATDWDEAGELSAAEVDAILASTEFQDELSNWDRARQLQGEAKDLMAAFQGEREAGDAGWRDKARDAKTKYEEALQRGEVYRDSLAGAIGEEDYQVRRLDKLLQAWRRDLMGLRKTVK